MRNKRMKADDEGNRKRRSEDIGTVDRKVERDVGRE